MPSKKKSPASKHKVELKNLTPKKTPKGGALTIAVDSGQCAAAPKYCSGLIT
jgi:hypothetical protein